MEKVTPSEILSLFKFTSRKNLPQARLPARVFFTRVGEFLSGDSRSCLFLQIRCLGVCLGSLSLQIIFLLSITDSLSPNVLSMTLCLSVCLSVFRLGIVDPCHLLLCRSAYKRWHRCYKYRCKGRNDGGS